MSVEPLNSSWWLVVYRQKGYGANTCFQIYNKDCADDAISSIIRDFFNAKLVNMLFNKETGETKWEQDTNITYPENDMRLMFVKGFQNQQEFLSEKEKWLHKKYEV